MNDLLQQIKEKLKNIYMSLFRRVFSYKAPGQMLQTLHSLEAVGNYNQATSFIEDNFVEFEDSVKTMGGDEKNK